MTAGKRRSGYSCSTVLLAVLAISALAVGAAAYGYFRFLRYDRVAAHHLPPDTVAAARIDIEQGVLYEPVRRQWVPLLGELLSSKGGDPESSIHRFEQRTGLRRIDLREIVLGRGASWTDWVLVMAGIFPKEVGVVRRVHEALESEGVKSFRLAGDGRRMVQAESGVAFGQAPDGALILASSVRVLDAALPEQRTYADIGLPVDAAAGLAVRGEVLRHWASDPVLSLAPGLSELARIDRVTGTVTLGERLQVELLAVPQRSEDMAGLEAGVERVLAALRLLATLDPRPDVAGERSALQRATVSRVGDRGVAVSFGWEKFEVERGAAAAADVIRRAIAARR